MLINGMDRITDGETLTVMNASFGHRLDHPRLSTASLRKIG